MNGEKNGRKRKRKKWYDRGKRDPFRIANRWPDGRAFVEMLTRSDRTANGIKFGLRERAIPIPKVGRREESEEVKRRREEKRGENEGTEGEKKEEGSGMTAAAARRRRRRGLFIHRLTVLRDKPWTTRSFSSQSLNCRFVRTDEHVRRQTCSTYDR